MPLRELGAHALLGFLAIAERVLLPFVGRVHAAVPDDDVAGAVFLLRNHAFERGVVERMVLGFDGEALLAQLVGRTLRHGPRLEHAIELEPEIVVQAAGGVLLDDEQQRPGARHHLGFRLGRARERPLGGVGVERSGHWLKSIMLARMIDKYSRYEELARAEVSGTDYRVVAVARPESPVVVIAPHGGGIEVGTSEIAARIAGDEHSFFSFEGLKAYGENWALHITSHRFDHPGCLALVSRSELAVGIHGCRGEAQIYIGGLDTELIALFAHHLSGAGFRTSTDGHRYLGRNPLNICNRGARGRGAQLEITKDLRDGPASERIADIVRGALAEYIARSA